MKKHIAALDGFRGLAILGVFLIHVRLLPLGWVGVPMFFVLSGYLCTAGLLRRGTPFGFNFIIGTYAKRLTRILPPYLFYIGFCAVLFLIFSIPSVFPDYWLNVITLTYNFRRMVPGFADSDFFGHLWFLCVLEQLFLVWPVLICGFHRRFLGVVFCMLIAAGPLFRFGIGFYLDGLGYDTRQIARVVTNFPLSHVDSIAFGSLLALLPVDSLIPRKFNLRILFASIVGITVAIGLAWAYHLERTLHASTWKSLGFDYGMRFGHQYVWAWSLIGICSLLLLVMALHDPLFKRIFESRPLRFMGRISYGFYLWHLPILNIVSGPWNPSPHSVAGLLKIALVFTISLVLGWLVHRVIERQFGTWLSHTVDAMKIKWKLVGN